MKLKLIKTWTTENGKKIQKGRTVDVLNEVGRQMIKDGYGYDTQKPAPLPAPKTGKKETKK